MALRSGTPHIDRWPDVATAADLFNVAGSPNQSPFVEAGDREYVDGVGVYQCDDAMLGAAVWTLVGGAGLPTIPYLDYSAASGDYYQAPVGVCAGEASGDFLFAIHIRLDNPEPYGPVYFLRCGNPDDGGSPNGYYLLLNYDNLEFRGVTATGEILNQGVSITDTYFGVPGYKYGRDAILLYQVYQDGGVTKVRFWVNGAPILNSPAAGTAGFTPGVTELAVGPDSGAFFAGISGYAYFAGTATYAQITTFFNACYEQRKIVNAGPAWTNLWTVADNTPGATWAPTAGADDLTRIGVQLPQVSPTMRWA